MSSGRLITEKEQRLFTEYLGALSSAGIPFILLRNYEEFPSRIGHDLDLFIPRADCARSSDIFRSLLSAAGGKVLIVNERDYFLDIRFILDTPVADAIHLDLFHGSFTWHSLHYLSEAELLAHRGSYRGFPVPRPAHEAFNLVFGSILWGGFFKARYRPRIKALLQDETDYLEFEACVLHAFGAAGKPPFNLLAETGPSENTIRKYAKTLRGALKWECFKRAPLGTVKLLLRHWKVELASLLRPKGYHLAFLGPDGAGKSTVIDGVLKQIGELFGERYIYHWRPQLLPDVGVLLGKRKASIEPEKSPHGKSQHSVAWALVRLAWYWLDYWLAWPIRILKPKALSRLVVFDRYGGDTWCDPVRYRYGKLPGWLLKVAASLVPRPDFTFVLVADEASLAKRKGELPPDAVASLLARYRKWAGSGSSRFLIDASRPIDQVVGEVCGIILKSMQRRESV